MMDVSSVQKTRLTFTLVSTPMLVAQHEILNTSLFKEWVVDGLNSWSWSTTPFLIAPLFGVTLMLGLRAFNERIRYSPSARVEAVTIPIRDPRPHIKSQHKLLKDELAKLSEFQHAQFRTSTLMNLKKHIEALDDCQISNIYLLNINFDISDIINSINDFQNKTDINKNHNIYIISNNLKQTLLNSIREGGNIMNLRKQIGKIDAAGNCLSEVAYPVAVWFVLLWPLLILPALLYLYAQLAQLIAC